MMSFSTNGQYHDSVLALARDPNLNKEQSKSSELTKLIQNFPLTEKKVTRLCSLCLKILPTLEKIGLTLKNWAFLSLDINSSNHFDNKNPSNIKTFNNNVSMRVIDSCQELTVKLNKISTDIDFITSALKTLSPREYVSDSGTLLTSLLLRSIKLKDELREKITIAYLKAKLITIGTNLEWMLEGGTPEQIETVSSYQNFVVSLLGQLNTAVENNDEEDKNECLAVISDMEQMFEVYKLEYAQTMSEASAIAYELPETYDALKEASYAYADSVPDSSSVGMSSTSPLYSNPMVHSITGTPTEIASPGSARRNSVDSLYTSNSILQGSTLTEELPYLMSAFNLAKTLEKDVSHFKEEIEPQHVEQKNPAHEPITTEKLRGPPAKKVHTPKNSLPESLLYSNEQVFPSMPQANPNSYIYANNSLLSKFGIKPQVISTPATTQLGQSFIPNKAFGGRFSKTLNFKPEPKALEDKKEDKENDLHVSPLTAANLETHNLSALKPDQLDQEISLVE